jgi:hypothetical protein
MKRSAMAAARWAREFATGFYPFGLCLFGAGILNVEAGWISYLVGATTLIWALDLSASRAAAKAKIETAAMFVAQMVSGRDTQITVDINHNEGK